ncbi:MAG TPA: NAD(P)-dependent oxidoreductase [Thermoanaerobaculia bacterium]
MPAAFVTGGTGFVGWHVAKALLAQGWTVRALARGGSRRRSGLEELPVEIVAGDLSSRTELVRALAGCAAVVHTAGLVKARTLADYRAVNVGGTEDLLSAAREASPDAVFVFVSSQAAAGPARDGRPVGEGDPARPVSWYGRSKLEGEEAVAAGWKGPRIAIRPGVLYGPRDRGLLTYFRMAAGGVVPVPAGSRRIQIGAVEETAVAVARAAGRPDLSGRVGFLCDPTPVTVSALASSIAAGAGRAVRMVPIPDAAVRVAGAVETLRERITGVSRPFNADKARELLAGDWLCDPGPMRRDLDVPASVPLDEGLRRAWEWYREKGWLGA